MIKDVLYMDVDFVAWTFLLYMYIEMYHTPLKRDIARIWRNCKALGIMNQFTLRERWMADIEMCSNTGYLPGHIEQIRTHDVLEPLHDLRVKCTALQRDLNAACWNFRQLLLASIHLAINGDIERQDYTGKIQQLTAQIEHLKAAQHYFIDIVFDTVQDIHGTLQPRPSFLFKAPHKHKKTSDALHQGMNCIRSRYFAAWYRAAPQNPDNVTGQPFEA